MPEIRVEFRLPGLVIGLGDIRTAFRRRAKDAGPFLLISRANGLSLDTAFGVDNGAAPHLWTTHGQLHQLWFLKPSGTEGEVTIVSAANGLALDATTAMSGDVHPLMWELHKEPWQRWKLLDSPDGVGYMIESTHNRMCLTSSDEAQPYVLGSPVMRLSGRVTGGSERRAGGAGA